MLCRASAVLLALALACALTACAGLPTATPQAKQQGAPSATTLASSAPSAASWVVTVSQIERPTLPKRDPGPGKVWLLMRVTVANNTGKAASIVEDQFRLTVDAEVLSPDLDAINAAEDQTKEKGFGNTLGTSVKAGAAETRILVFGVPGQAQRFTLALKTDKKATADLAAPVDLSASVAQLPALLTPAPVPPATTRPSTNTSPAPAPTRTPTAGPQAYGLNELVSVKNWDLAIQKVERPGKELVWSQFGNSSQAAGTWFVVVVDMKNTGNQNFGVNTFDFELKAGAVTYKVSDDLGTYSYSEFKGGQSIGGQVPPGVTVTYHVVFDIAPDATDLQFSFKQDKRPIFAVGNAGTGTAPPSSAAPSAAPAAGPSNGQAYGLNELARVKNWDLAMVGVERPGKELVWSQFGNKSTAAGTWLVLAVEMKNTGSQNFGVNTFDFELTDGKGNKYAVSSDFGVYSYGELKGGQRIGGQVPPGVTVKYYVIFDVAPDAAGLTLTFKQDTRPRFQVVE